MTTPLGYDGQYTNSDTGLIYLRVRSYDPATAQFLSVDPFAQITRTPYAYAEDNPPNFGDPTGLWSPTEGLEKLSNEIGEGISNVTGGFVNGLTGGPVTAGNVIIHMKTANAVTCAALKSGGEAITETSAIFHWKPNGLGNSMSTFTMPLAESSISLGGAVAMGSMPFSEETISGAVKQTYSGTCGGKKVKKGTFSGSIRIF